MAHGTWKTTGGGGGGGGIAALALMIGAAIGIVEIAPLLLSAVVAIAQAVAFAVVFIAVIAVAVWRLRSRRPLRELPVRRPLPHAQARVLPARQAQPTAIENHYHFHGVSADDIAEALARRQEQS